MESSQRLYRTVAGDIVAEDDPAAAFLVVGEGGEVPEEFEAAVKKFLGGRKQAEPTENKKAEPAANKAAAAKKS